MDSKRRTAGPSRSDAACEHGMAIICRGVRVVSSANGRTATHFDRKLKEMSERYARHSIIVHSYCIEIYIRYY